MRLTAPQLFAPSALLFAMALGACSSTEEAVYSLQIIGPADAFVGASSAVLYKRDQEIARAAVNGQGAFTLEVGGVDPSDADGTAIFVVRGLNAQGGLVAYGETPLLETLPTAQELKIFVQRPGTVARSSDFPVKLRNQTVLKAETQPTTSVNLAMTAPVFAHGEEVVEQAGAAVTNFTRALYIYNPLSHAVEKVFDLPMPRSEVFGFARSDGALFLFGGFLLPVLAPNPAATPGLKASQQLDLLVVGRENFKKFTLPSEAAPITTADPSTARAGAVVAAVGTRRLLIGGIDDYAARTPLASVAAFEEPSLNVFAVRPHKPMAVAREGHTATSDPSATAALPTGTVLVYGGALTPAGPVAEVLRPVSEDFTPVTFVVPAMTTAHTNRKFHQAVVLPNKDPTSGLVQVLILGGFDDAGVPRADSVLCIPSLPTNQCQPGAVVLHTPRANFAAFVLNNDLVVTGGVGPTNMPVATTEIYDARTLLFVNEVPSLARSHVSATTLPNLSAIITGGLMMGGEVATAVEIYQPRRAN